jgi:RNA polymerase sigma-70 factor (ECF subfamily)
MDNDVLASRLAENLDSAFEALVLAHQDRLYTIALRLLGSPEDAEEVAQDALVRAYRALAGWDDARIRALQLRPWLAAIVVNLARNRRRRHADRNPPLSLAPLVAAGLEPPATETGGPVAAGLRREAAAAWAVRLLRCPPALRTAVILRHVDGLSYDEIARALDRPIGTIKARVHRGLANLRSQLEAERAAGTLEELSA